MTGKRDKERTARTTLKSGIVAQVKVSAVRGVGVSVVGKRGGREKWSRVGGAYLAMHLGLGNEREVEM